MEELEKLLSLARDVNIICSNGCGGMASISVLYHPYKAHWEVQASWSNGNTVTTNHVYVISAIQQLEYELRKLIQNNKTSS